MEFNSLLKFQEKYSAERIKYENKLKKINKILKEFIDRVIDNELKNAPYMTHTITYNKTFVIVCNFNPGNLKNELNDLDNEYFHERNRVLKNVLGIEPTNLSWFVYAELTPKIWNIITSVVNMNKKELELWKRLNL